ncbi:hypothetical protein I4U23_009299 [Adineta vaga]|nr:hypothetical protein I4U23_009299 [Adineta vaga]
MSVSIISQVNSDQIQPDILKHSALSNCNIHDYSTWKLQLFVLEYLRDNAHRYRIDRNKLRQSLEQFRLQEECLKTIEFPLIIAGPG